MVIPSSSIVKLSLRSNFSWTLLGNVVYAGCQWGMLVLLVKLSTVEAVGQFTLGTSVTAPIILFSNLQLRPIQATDVKQLYAFQDYLLLRIITTILAFGVIIGLVNSVGYTRETALVVLLIGLAKSIESIGDVYYGLLQQHERMDWIAISMIVKGLLSLVALGLTVFLTHSVVGGTLALAVAWTIVLVWYDIPKGRRMTSLLPQAKPSSPTSKFRPRILLKLTLFALPLGFAMTLISLNTNIPRYFVERYLGTAPLGIFAAIAYLQIAGMTLVMALGQSASPRLAQYYAEGQRREFNQLLVKLLAIVTLLGGGGILVSYFAGEQLLTVLYRPEYGKDTQIFVWIMVSSALSYLASIFGFAATAKRRIYNQPMVLFAALGVSVVSCYAWVPTYGLLGAASSMVATSAVTLLGYILIVYKK